MKFICILTLSLMGVYASSFAAEDAFDDASHMTLPKIERRMAATQQLFNAEMLRVKHMVATLEANANPNADLEDLANKTELLLQAENKCKEYNIKLNRLKTICQKKIAQEKKDASAHRLAHMQAIVAPHRQAMAQQGQAPTRSVARTLKF